MNIESLIPGYQYTETHQNVGKNRTICINSVTFADGGVHVLYTWVDNPTDSTKVGTTSTMFQSVGYELYLENRTFIIDEEMGLDDLYLDRGESNHLSFLSS